ncbi:hypothetical protein [Spirosoma flavum]|uniref:Uncharacterized protein n=1 Tax=Spirosoma flavum TaxID=2048557 RepID=A0ABW6ABI0_9BACT
MSAISRGVVYSLIAVILVLLLGIAAMLSIAYHRHQRLEDTTIDLQRNLSQQKGQIKDLQQRLDDCDTIQTMVPVDTTWGKNAPIDSASVISMAVRYQQFLQ